MSDNEKRGFSFSTQAVHAGDDGQAVKASSVPIYASSTFLGDDAAALDEVLGGAPGYVYSRFANPTTAALEKAVATLENATECVAFGSGMAALHGALLACALKAGDTVLIAQEIYGSCHALVETLLVPLGVQWRAVDVTDLEAVRCAFETSGARVLLFETVSNPLNKVADVAALCSLARQASALSIVDATFTPPPLLRVLELGADFAMHSATKYLGGHGDATGGVVSIRDEKFLAPLRAVLRLGGAILSPFEAFLVLRGLKTLPLRVREQCHNAVQIAQWLQVQPGVAQVFYPGLPRHPQHELAARSLQPFKDETLFGAMLSFEIAGAEREEIFRFLDALQLIKVATTLGDVVSEMSYPLISSHRGWSEEKLQIAGIKPGIVRLSCGIEDVADLIADLEGALRKSRS
jgi:cystathionine beta-lyase/cystathionine gamma-synthase